VIIHNGSDGGTERKMAHITQKMTRSYRYTVGGVLASALVATALFAVTGQSARAAQDEASIWDGVYTDEQAERGGTTYMQECAACHLDDMLGDGIAPPLVGVPFSFRWTDLSVGDMYMAIRTTMPQGAPASLSPQGYVDIVAYMLSRNDIPSGDAELPTDEDALQEIIIDEQQ